MPYICYIWVVIALEWVFLEEPKVAPGEFHDRIARVPPTSVSYLIQVFVLLFVPLFHRSSIHQTHGPGGMKSCDKPHPFAPIRAKMHTKPHFIALGPRLDQFWPATRLLAGWLVTLKLHQPQEPNTVCAYQLFYQARQGKAEGSLFVVINTRQSRHDRRISIQWRTTFTMSTCRSSLPYLTRLPRVVITQSC
jgi:hypothetical protein